MRLQRRTSLARPMETLRPAAAAKRTKTTAKLDLRQALAQDHKATQALLEFRQARLLPQFYHKRRRSLLLLEKPNINNNNQCAQQAAVMSYFWRLRVGCIYEHGRSVEKRTGDSRSSRRHTAHIKVLRFFVQVWTCYHRRLVVLKLGMCNMASISEWHQPRQTRPQCTCTTTIELIIMNQRVKYRH